MACLPLTRTPSARRVLLGVAGVAALVVAVELFGPWALALWLWPDVALLVGWSREHAAEGRLAPRAVPLYNALHALPGPMTAVALSLVVGASDASTGLAVLWLSHVLIDRCAGYGLRTRDGSQRG